MIQFVNNTKDLEFGSIISDMHKKLYHDMIWGDLSKDQLDNLLKENIKSNKKKAKQGDISVKIGRPAIGDELISKRFSLAFTETEYNIIKNICFNFTIFHIVLKS